MCIWSLGSRKVGMHASLPIHILASNAFLIHLKCTLCNVPALLPSGFHSILGDEHQRTCILSVRWENNSKYPLPSFCKGLWELCPIWHGIPMWSIVISACRITYLSLTTLVSDLARPWRKNAFFSMANRRNKFAVFYVEITGNIGVSPMGESAAIESASSVPSLRSRGFTIM